MPPLAVGPPGDPQGLGPNAGTRAAARPDVPDAGPLRRADVPAAASRAARQRCTAAATAAGRAAMVVRRRIPALVRQGQPVDFPLLTTSADPERDSRQPEHDSARAGQPHHLRRDSAASGSAAASSATPTGGSGARDRLLHRAEGRQSPVRDFGAVRNELGWYSAPGSAVHRHDHGSEQSGGHEIAVRRRQCTGLDHDPDVGSRGDRGSGTSSVRARTRSTSVRST